MMSCAYRHRWTQDEIDTVRREYAGTHESRNALAIQLGVTANSISYMVGKLGLATKNNYRRWTPEEDARLTELLETMTVESIARKMRRSLDSVTVRVQRLGLSRRDRYGWYTKTEVCAILGKDHKWVQRRIDDGSLKASWHHGRRPQPSGQAAWHIYQADLKRFLRTYPEELNGRNVDLVQVVEILAGLL